MGSVVALIDLKEDRQNGMREAIDQIGGIDDINMPERDVVVKVGVFSVEGPHHSSVEVVDWITRSFDRTPKLYLAESDNYQGTGTDRLQLWKDLFSERIVPFDLSLDTDTTPITIENPIKEVVIDLSHIVFKPNVFVSTHVLRRYSKGSILKNLFGLPPIVKKAQFHKNEIFHVLLADLYQAIGGIDLAVLDGTHFAGKNTSIPTDILVVGRDAVAVEAVGLKLAGNDPDKNKTIEEFVRRGYGEGNLDKIEIVGASLDMMIERCKTAVIELKSKAKKAWSPALSINRLIKSGFFKHPGGRTKEDVEKALIEEDTRAEGRLQQIYSTLKRRVKMGVLKEEKGPEGWCFWSD
ncbi:MAG: DUF362 domain-containing protein [Candidatus Thorarchaeota archaeon]